MIRFPNRESSTHGIEDYLELTARTISPSR